MTDLKRLTCVYGVSGGVYGAIVIRQAGLVLQRLVLAGVGINVAPGPCRLGSWRGAGAIELRRLISSCVCEVPAAQCQAKSTRNPLLNPGYPQERLYNVAVRKQH